MQWKCYGNGCKYNVNATVIVANVQANSSYAFWVFGVFLPWISLIPNWLKPWYRTHGYGGSTVYNQYLLNWRMNIPSVGKHRRQNAGFYLTLNRGLNHWYPKGLTVQWTAWIKHRHTTKIPQELEIFGPRTDLLCHKRIICQDISSEISTIP